MATTAIDLSNIQGDVLTGLPKKAETFFFFKITQANAFRDRLRHVVPLIASVEHVNLARERISQHRLDHAHPLPIGLLNIAFSSKGLKTIGVDDTGIDDDFTNGQLSDAENLGDAVSDWKPEFKKGDIDGVILVAGDCLASVNFELERALTVLFGTIKTVINVFGHVRPGKESGHEHFGFEDGISNPAVDGVGETDLSGQGFIDPGVILLGRKGDPVTSRPSWALDGSFLAFRLLQQLVPEFNIGVAQAAPQINDPSTNAVDLLSARLVGRWKSGAPVQLSPLKDDPALAADPARNNKFSYDDQRQEKCPFAAHTRKMNPRGDSVVTQPAIDAHRVVRQGIPYGPEVTPAEKRAKRTEKERGLLFVSYQSSLANGFAFLQKTWANPANFPPQKPQVPGIDPIIGVDTADTGVSTREMSGLDLDDPTKTLNFQKWVVPRGGEYFFSPSISVLRSVFAKKLDDEL